MRPLMRVEPIDAYPSLDNTWRHVIVPRVNELRPDPAKPWSAALLRLITSWCTLPHDRRAPMLSLVDLGTPLDDFRTRTFVQAWRSWAANMLSSKDKLILHHAGTRDEIVGEEDATPVHVRYYTQDFLERAQARMAANGLATNDPNEIVRRVWFSILHAALPQMTLPLAPTNGTTSAIVRALSEFAALPPVSADLPVPDEVVVLANDEDDNPVAYRFSLARGRR